MSLQLAAQHLASKGRGPDRMLVHMTPREVQSLQAVAMAHGGSLTINPETGLPEAGFLSSILPMIAGVGLTALSGGTLSPMMAGLLTGGGTALATGNLQKGLMAGLGAYGGAGLGAGLAGVGATQAGNAAAAELAGTNANLAQTLGEGANAKDILLARGAQSAGPAMQALNANPVQMSMTDKMLAGAKGLMDEGGRDAFMQQMGGGKGLMKYGAAALSPMLMARSGETAQRPSTGSPYQFEFDAGATGAAPSRDTGETRYFAPRLRRMADGGSTGMTGESDAYYRYLMGLAPAPSPAAISAATGTPATSLTEALAPTVARTTTASRPGTYYGGDNIGAANPGDGVAPISNMTADQQAEFYAQNPTFAAITQGLQGLFGMTSLGALQKAMVPDFVASRTQAAQGLKPSNYGYNEGLGYYSLGNGNVDQYVAATDTPGIFSAPVGGVGMHATPAGGIPGGLGLNPSNTGIGLTTAGANLANSGYSLTAGPSSGPTGPTGADEEDAALGAAISAAIANATSPDSGPVGVGPGADANTDVSSVDAVNGADAASDAAAAAASADAAAADGQYAYGGLTAFANGGYNLGDYSDGGRLLRGPGDGVSDSIPASIANKRPARLADGEFVIPARIVSELGNGSTEAGARKLYAMMDRVQSNRSKTTGKGRVAVNSRSDKYLPA